MARRGGGPCAGGSYLDSSLCRFSTASTEQGNTWRLCSWDSPGGRGGIMGELGTWNAWEGAEDWGSRGVEENTGGWGHTRGHEGTRGCMEG